MPCTGGTGEADDVVAQLIRDIGFRPVALGDEPDALAAVDALARSCWPSAAATAAGSASGR